MTLYFFYRTVLFYVLEHAYLFWRFRPFWRERAALRRLAPVWFVCMALFPLIFLWLPPDSWEQRVFARVGGIWQTVAYFCLLAFLFLDILRLGVWLKRRFFSGCEKRRPDARADASVKEKADGSPAGFSALTEGLPPVLRRPALVLIALGAVFFAYGLYEAGNVRLTRLEVVTDKLPPGRDSLRLAFAADLHVSPRLGEEYLRRVVDMLLAQKPDCILLGGDILDDAMQGTPADFQELGRLRAPLGVYAVLGNHEAFGDAARPARELRRAGINVLAGQGANAGPLRIVGVDDPWVNAGGEDGATHDPLPLLRRTEPGRYTLLLTHRPNLTPGSVGLFDLQASGHTHGGQIFLLAPLMWEKFGLASGLLPLEEGGEKSLLFVTSGVGWSKLPIRLFVPPEVVIIDLVAAR